MLHNSERSDIAETDLNLFDSVLGLGLVALRLVVLLVSLAVAAEHIHKPQLGKPRSCMKCHEG